MLLAELGRRGRGAPPVRNRTDSLARERLAGGRSRNYRGGKGDLGPVLEARKAEIETRIAQLQATTEMARAWAQLTFLLPVHHGEHP